MKSVDKMEREYRARLRANGVKLFTVPAKFTREQDAYCRARQISRSEYTVELIKADKPNRERALAAAWESEAA